MWLKSKKFLGHIIYFKKNKIDNWTRYFIDSKTNYSGDSPTKEIAFKEAKLLIRRSQS